MTPGRVLMKRAVLGALAAALLAIGLPAMAQEGPGEADRVVVRYSEGAYELVSVTPITSHLAPADDLPEGEFSGFWFELVSSEGDVLYRRITGHPVPLVFEGPDQSAPEPTIIRTAIEPDFVESRKGAVRTSRGEVDRFLRSDELLRDRQTGEALSPRSLTTSAEDPDRTGSVPGERVFALLVPRAQEGDELVLFSSPLEEGQESEAAGEVARLPLVEDQGGES